MKRTDIRRLEKIIGKSTTIVEKQQIYEWCMNVSQQIETDLEIQYNNKFQDELKKSIDLFILTIIFNLRFNEKTHFGQKRIDDFRKDLVATVDMFSKGEYSPLEYKKMLENDGIKVDIDLRYLE